MMDKMKISAADHYIRIKYDGLETSYPKDLFNVHTAWKDFYRQIRCYRETRPFCEKAPYTVNTPVKRPVWKNHNIIGYVTMSRVEADKRNDNQNSLYFGFTEEERDILQNGTEKDLRAAGFINDGCYIL